MDARSDRPGCRRTQLIHIEEARERAREAAGSKEIRIGGGVSTICQYLQARLVDEMHLAISPVLLGSGEHLLSGLDLRALGYEVGEHTPSDAAMHVVLTRSAERQTATGTRSSATEA